MLQLIQSCALTLRSYCLLSTIYYLLFCLSCFLCLCLSTTSIYAGPVKTGGAYKIEGDAFSGGGTISLTGASYSLANNFSLPVGFSDLSGGQYLIEGGTINGYQANFTVVVTIESVTLQGSPTVPIPGALILCRTDFSNTGDASAANTSVTIPIPDYTTFFPTYSIDNTKGIQLNGVEKTNADDADECKYNAVDRNLICLPGILSTSETGTIRYQVTID